MTAVLELALRPLPQSVKPFPGEIVSSYVGRLTDVNRLDKTALLRYVTGTRQTHDVPVEGLAVIAGVPRLVLERAIADLGNAKLATKHYFSYDRSVAIHTKVSGPACQLCAVVAGATRAITCWRPAEKVLCLQRRLLLEAADKLVSWPDPTLRMAAATLLTEGARMAQEAVGLSYLTSHNDWLLDVSK